MTDQAAEMTSLSLPGHLIRRLHQMSTFVFHRHVQALGYDLTPVQFSALDALRSHPEIDQKGLAQLVAKDRATLGTVVERLEQKGLVARRISSDDKRARVLTLTDEGAKLLAELLPVVTALQKEILPGLDESEYAAFVKLAAKAAAAAPAYER